MRDAVGTAGGHLAPAARKVTSMRADNNNHIVAAAQQRAVAARERAERTLEEFHPEGRSPSVAGLARAAGVSRS